MSYTKSIALTERSRKVTPGGTQTMSKYPSRFPEGAYPAYLQWGEGAQVWDVDDNRYVDYICALGAVSLGYDNPQITNAVREQAPYPLSSLGSPLEEEVASMLVDLIPCAEQVRFVKTGSEACSAAVRIARRATKRDHVIVVGYHGWHDWVQITSPDHPGIPWDGGKVIRVPYNDLDAIEYHLDYTQDGAAVMLEPTLITPPHDGYLQGVKDLCEQYGALCIFDEMVCGFRWSVTGGSGYFGVQPHMAVYGKALANGFPLACVVGPRRVMKYADVISGTFGGECVSLAAAKEAIPQHAWGVNKQWQRGCELLGFCEGLRIPFSGYPVHPRIDYKGKKMALFLQETARRGVLFHPGGFNISAALTDEDMKTTWNALEGAVEAMKGGVKLEGKLPQQGILKRIT